MPGIREMRDEAVSGAILPPRKLSEGLDEAITSSA